ncbi:nitroreductase family protein [Bacillus cytotoxicus]|uniref:Nitroreductase n=1 Tax=Bacillus cytotoxicus TaxID=580165 RepID=A0AAX2CGF4_9BACI|nr:MULTISPECIES: nitroreductase family protein [Bacillus cereus group]QTR72679.1 nitroreductase family protein [Bacillus cytotoxicus]QTR77844.1 nitroreductase family protein [Bacillus cytotoxicus]QTR82338.1 nitroreductase family protein [Bacillus cytotoxicus]QTR86076.1 nitroreductase family protein [Bacillus cytotoxicus]SCL91351.1 Nitroreductase [Bacillus cytotoxicus]
MNYERFKEIVHGRRSIRKFTEQEVSVQDIEEIIDCARYAPSDTNSQTWEFIVIMNRDKIKDIENMTWEALHKLADQATKNGQEKAGKLLTRSFGPYATAFSDAPVLIICLATPYESKFREKIFDPISFVPEAVWEEEGMKSSCLAAQNLMLAAHARGLGTCPMTGPVLLAQNELREYLQIEREKQMNMVIALGYPKDHPRKLARKEVKEITKFIF